MLIGILCVFGCEKDIFKVVPESKSYTIQSDFMQKDYTFYVRYPPDFDSTMFYRTIILLDANDYYVEMANVLKADHNDGFVLVGVKYNEFKERITDFTFPHDDEIPGSGKADQYIQFLRQELLPYLTDELGIKSYDKTLLGHSLSGYFAAYVQFQQKLENPFDNIIAASPSLWWNDSYIFGLEEKFAESHSTLGVKYYTTIGDLEGAMMNTHFTAFVKKVTSRNYPQLEFMATRYKNTSHRNSPIVSFKDGLKFIQ